MRFEPHRNNFGISQIKPLRHGSMRQLGAIVDDLIEEIKGKRPGDEPGRTETTWLETNHNRSE